MAGARRQRQVRIDGWLGRRRRPTFKLIVGDGPSGEGIWLDTVATELDRTSRTPVQSELSERSTLLSQA